MQFIPHHIPILMYHQILPSSSPHFSDHIAVTPEHFKKQIGLILEKGYEISTLHDFFSKPNPFDQKNKAILTFDDVSSSYLDYALPILDSYKVKGCVFPIQNMIEGKEYFNLKKTGISPLLPSDLKQLFTLGHEIGSHCQTHQNLRKLSFENATNEIKNSKIWLENILGTAVKSICYPIGGVDSDIIKAAKEAGYVIGITTIKSTLQLKKDQLALRRINVKNDLQGKKFVSSLGPLYGFRRYLTRPFRAKYNMSLRHPDFS